MKIIDFIKKVFKKRGFCNNDDLRNEIFVKYHISILNTNYLMIHSSRIQRTYIIIDSDMYYVIIDNLGEVILWCRGDVSDLELIKYEFDTNINVYDNLILLNWSNTPLLVSKFLFATEQFFKKCLFNLKQKNV